MKYLIVAAAIIFTAININAQTVIGKINTQLDLEGIETPSEGYFKISYEDMSIRMYDRDMKQLVYRKIEQITLTKQHADKKEYRYLTNEGGLVALNVWDDKDAMSVQIVTKDNDYYGYICDLIQRY